MLRSNEMSDVATGRRVRDRRLECDRSIKDVSQDLDMCHSTYVKIEKGKRRLTDEEADKLADILDVDARELTEGWSKLKCEAVDAIVKVVENHEGGPTPQAKANPVVAFRKAG